MTTSKMCDDWPVPKPGEKEAAHTSCEGCKDEHWACDYVGCMGIDDDPPKRKKYTPAPAPAPKHSSCLGCEDENTEPVPHCCVHCSSAKTGDVEHYNWHTAPAPKDAKVSEPYQYCQKCGTTNESDCVRCKGASEFTPKQPTPKYPAPKVTDAPKYNAWDNRAIGWDKVFHACVELGFVPSYTTKEKTDDLICAFIRALAQRAGEGYVRGIEDAAKWLERNNTISSSEFNRGLYWKPDCPQTFAKAMRRSLLTDPQDGINAVTNRKGGNHGI